MKLVDLLAIFYQFRSELHPGDRPLRYKARTNKETYQSQTPLVPRYPDPESGNRNPASKNRKPRIHYGDEEN